MFVWTISSLFGPHRRSSSSVDAMKWFPPCSDPVWWSQNMSPEFYWSFPSLCTRRCSRNEEFNTRTSSVCAATQEKGATIAGWSPSISPHHVCRRFVVKILRKFVAVKRNSIFRRLRCGCASAQIFSTNIFVIIEEILSFVRSLWAVHDGVAVDDTLRSFHEVPVFRDLKLFARQKLDLTYVGSWLCSLRFIDISSSQNSQVDFISEAIDLDHLFGRGDDIKVFTWCSSSIDIPGSKISATPWEIDGWEVKFLRLTSCGLYWDYTGGPDIPWFIRVDIDSQMAKECLPGINLQSKPARSLYGESYDYMGSSMVTRRVIQTGIWHQGEPPKSPSSQEIFKRAPVLYNGRRSSPVGRCVEIKSP